VRFKSELRLETAGEQLMNEKLSNWESLVNVLASDVGYSEDLCLDDYYQDLFRREKVEREVLDVTDSQTLIECDQRFVDQTIPASRTWLEGDRWWHLRLPKRAGPELKAQAIAVGMVSEEVARDWLGSV